MIKEVLIKVLKVKKSSFIRVMRERKKKGLSHLSE